MKVTAEGHCVGLINRSYDFTSDEGERVSGQTRRLFIASGLGEEPTLVTVRRGDQIAGAAFDTFSGQVGFLDSVKVQVDVDKGKSYFLAGEVVAAPKRAA